MVAARDAHVLRAWLRSSAATLRACRDRARAGAAAAHRECSAQADRRIRAARSVAAALRRAGIPRRPGAHRRRTSSSAASPASARRRGRRELPCAQRQGTLVARPHRLSRTTVRPVIADVEMAPMLGPDGGRSARAAGTTPSRSPRTAARFMSASSACTRSCASTSARAACRARRSRSRCRPAFKTLPSNKGIEALVVVPRGRPLAGTLIAISERGLDPAGNLSRFLIGGPSPGTFSVKRTRRFRHQRLRAAAGRRSPDPGAPVLLDERRRHPHPPRRARQHQAGRGARRPDR